MHKFVFSAVDAQGQTRKGKIEADSEANARAAITGRGMQVLDISLMHEPTMTYDAPQSAGDSVPFAYTPSGPSGGSVRGGRAMPGTAAQIAQLGRLLLLVGLLMVLGARGCDSIGARGAIRLNASLSSQKAKFERQWKKKYNDAKDFQEKNKVQQEREKAHKEIEEKEWTQLQEEVDDASSGNQMWGYWREMAFVLGTLVLAAATVIGAYSGTPAERIFCMLLAGIIGFSIYIGGIAWVSALSGMFKM